MVCTPACKFSQDTNVITMPHEIAERDLHGLQHLMAEELWACAEHVRQHALQEALKALPVCWWDAIPGLGCATVQVIHTGQVHVLSVPAHRNMLCCIMQSTRVQQSAVLHLYHE